MDEVRKLYDGRFLETCELIHKHFGIMDVNLAKVLKIVYDEGLDEGRINV